MVQSVIKGYMMIQLLISKLPFTLYAFVNLVMGMVAVTTMFRAVTFVIGGKND